MRPPRRSPSITTLMLCVAILPALMMWLVVSATIYGSQLKDIRADIDERGRLLAAALAEASRYAVVSGNSVALAGTLQGLLASEPSIARIEVLGPTRQRLAGAQSAAEAGEAMPFEHPIRAQAIDVDLFDDPARPHVAGPPRDLRASPGEVLGHVRVLMSPQRLVDAKRRNLYFAGGVTLAAALGSGLLGLLLARMIHGPLAAIMAAVRDIRQGRYQVRLGSGRGGELGELQDAMAEMAGELAAARQELEEKVAHRTAALQAAVQAARAAEEEKRRLIAHGNALVEEERRRIAVEIHDQLNASLISVRLGAAALSARGGPPVAQDELERIAQRITRTTDQLYDSARRIVKRLRPEVLDTLGFCGAVAEAVRDYDTLHPECRFTLKVDERFPGLPGTLAINAYRVVQEALSNVVKHANATRVEVGLGVDEVRREIQVTVYDNGCGLPTEPARGAGLGLVGMRERAWAAGGVLRIAALPSQGTRIELRVPWPRP